MAREMSQGISGRNDIQKGQNTNKSINKKAAQDMAEQNVSYSKTNVLKYRLAQDQGYECPYCGQNKFGARDIYDGSVTNIEHIVPQSITQVGRKYSEVVLAHRHCNDEKGKRVPMEAFAFHTAPIEKFAKHLRSIKQERKALLLEMPETPNNTIDDALLNEFCDRQFNETAWITKITATWLRSLGINVECTKGQMTAQLRGQWQLESVIPEARIAEGLPVYSTHDEHGEIKETIVPFEAMFHDKDGKEPTLLWRYWNKQRLTPDEFAEIRKTGLYNIDKRSDHRHHLIDAITTALCSRSMVQQLAKEYKQRSEEEAKKPEGTQKYIRMGRRAVPMAKLRDKALEAVKAQKVTHRPDRQGGGAWFQEMAYGLYVDDMQQAHLTRRYPVRDLIGKDEAATVGNIEGVIGIEIKKALLAEHTAFCQANWGNISPKKDDYAKAALSLWLTPPLHPRTGRPIIKVRQVKAAYLASKHIEVKHRNKQGVTLNKYLICDENAYIAWNPNDPADGYKVVNNYGARGNAKLPDGWMRVYKGDTVLAKNGVRYVAVSLNEAANRVETMQMVCATSSLKQEEGRQNFLLTLPKRQGSVSLWDIIKIQEDPFHGRPTRIDD
jgi:CRISPR-associated endonuclease Csn1